MTRPDDTLLSILQERLPGESKTTLRQLLKHDRVLLDGRPERDAKRAVAPGQRVEIVRKGASDDPRIRIVHEDSDLIVIEKSERLLTVAAATGGEDNAEDLLNASFGARAGEKRIQHVHRLDRDASGLLVFAKSAPVRDRLREQFAAHAIERVYVAIVNGSLREPAGTLRSFLFEDRDLRVRSVADPSAGKKAVTHYRTTASGSRYSMLEATLETGRRNQIRVHLADAGHAILGDRMYGRDGDGPIGRLALHARQLGFVHPGSGRRLSFSAEPPPSFGDLRL